VGFARLQGLSAPGHKQQLAAAKRGNVKVSDRQGGRRRPHPSPVGKFRTGQNQKKEGCPPLPVSTSWTGEEVIGGVITLVPLQA
jgi:hypothetical protein